MKKTLLITLDVLNAIFGAEFEKPNINGVSRIIFDHTWLLWYVSNVRIYLLQLQYPN